VTLSAEAFGVSNAFVCMVWMGRRGLAVQPHVVLQVWAS
jgi:hypothetical protein